MSEVVGVSENYYKPCRELDICNELIEKYFNTQQYEKCFEGHLVLAEQGYPLAECQVGYFYYDGLGVEKDLAKAVWWTRRAADHGDRDGHVTWLGSMKMASVWIVIWSRQLFGTGKPPCRIMTLQSTNAKRWAYPWTTRSRTERGSARF